MKLVKNKKRGVVDMKKSCNICRSKGKLTILNDDVVINEKGEYVCSECMKEEAEGHNKSGDE